MPAEAVERPKIVCAGPAPSISYQTAASGSAFLSPAAALFSAKPNLAPGCSTSYCSLSTLSLNSRFRSAECLSNPRMRFSSLPFSAPRPAAQVPSSASGSSPSSVCVNPPTAPCTTSRAASARLKVSAAQTGSAIAAAPAPATFP